MKNYDIILTDIQLHAQKPRKPDSFFRKIMKSLRSRKSGRAYSTLPTSNTNGTFVLPITLSPEEQVDLARAKSEGKNIRFFIPKAGLPMYAGQDVNEYLKAHPERQAKKFDT